MHILYQDPDNHRPDASRGAGARPQTVGSIRISLAGVHWFSGWFSTWSSDRVENKEESRDYA